MPRQTAVYRASPGMTGHWRPLTGLYEPSGIVQLPDGRFLVVEDERDHALSVATIAASGGVDTRPLTAGWFDFDGDFWKLDDLEGLTIDARGRVLAVTSHSRSGDGGVKTSRSRLVRFTIDGDAVIDRGVCTTLRAALAAAHPRLAAAAAEANPKSASGLNIEALEFDPARGTLLVGFRSPLDGAHALIAVIENPDAIFDHGAAPRIAPELIALDLAGHGLRGIGHIPALAGYLLISGPCDRAETPFRLWFWRGPGGPRARLLALPELADLAHAEGLCAATLGGEPCVLIVSDDGDRKRDRAASFVLLQAARLRRDT